MPDFRRNYLPGGTFFFTVVTAGRAEIFNSACAVAMLRRSVRRVRNTMPFSIEAAVILPDHLHMIWTLPKGDTRYSKRWSAIKSDFTRAWLAKGGSERPPTKGYHRQRRRGIWQPRFMEHTIRDEDDFIHHVEYIHFNPVKHGLVDRPRDWNWSSFGRYVNQGVYDADWASAGPHTDPILAPVTGKYLE